MTSNVPSVAVVTVSLIMATMGVSHCATWTIDLEGGPVVAGYNDVRIPNETGTKISLTDDLDADVEPYWRLRAGVAFGRHSISTLVAPLSLDAAGSAAKLVVFEDTEFPAGTDLRAKYKFNSYRLTWRYSVLVRPSWRFDIGFTGKIRDASVLVESSQSTAEKTNVGFVPLINFLLSWRLSPCLHLTLDGDALAAPQGRAEDVALLVNYDASSRLSLKAGYRLLEGGADVEDVYSFALLHYGVVGLTFHM